jgi:hypothetical protein
MVFAEQKMVFIDHFLLYKDHFLLYKDHFLLRKDLYLLLLTFKHLLRFVSWFRSSTILIAIDFVQYCRSILNEK